MWSTILFITSILFAAACFYLIFSVGLSIYLESWRPLEFGIIFAFLLYLSEIVVGIASD